MKAIKITKPGSADVLSYEEYLTPHPEANEVIIRVKAAGINRADIAQREGKYPAPEGVAADIPGLEVSGIIESCGPSVNRWKVGDEVCALLAGGGYAESVAVHEGHCLPVPVNFDFVQAASLPEAVFTVWSNVFMRGQLKQGETLLIHGGNSGIGIAAIQLGKLFGAKVYVTVGSEEKGSLCMDQGADGYVNYKTSDFAEHFKTDGPDVILDMVGGDYFPKNLEVLRPEGRLVYINAVAGNKVPADIALIMKKRLTITGSTLRSRDAAFKTFLAKEIEQTVWPLMSSGQFKPVIYKTFALENAPEAHKALEEGNHSGKIILVAE